MIVPVPPPDPDVPALVPLLGEEAAGLLSSVLAMAGGALHAHRVSQVRYLPGRSVTVQYGCDVEWAGDRATKETLVATSGIEVPAGTPVWEAGEVHVALWRYPNDPFLPGLPAAADPRRTGEVLESLGAPPGRARLRARAYRAGRRAVIESATDTNRIFLKVVRPSRVAALQERHRALADHLPVPASYGWSPRQGILALQAIHGHTLRAAIAGTAVELPSPDAIRDLLDRIPALTDSRSVPGPHRRSIDHTALLAAVAPRLSSRLARIVSALERIGSESDVPVHGDFHSSQILVDGPTVIGLVDIDTVGLGERSNDLAGLLGHLATLPLSSGARRRADAYGSELLASFDRWTDPHDLRLRVAAVVLGLATGPFRVQMAQWEAETERRLDVAERWIRSARATR